MDETEKLPIKRVELSLSKFNEVAIPHHLDLLRQHRANIIKYSSSGEYTRVRAEQTHARRVCGQLRALLQELEALRARVRTADLPAFDAHTRTAVTRTLQAITDYLDTSPISANRVASQADMPCGSLLSTDSVGVLPEPDPDSPQQIQLQIDEQELSLAQREAVLGGWSELQDEVRALHSTWSALHGAAARQREQVEQTAARVEESHDNVEAARAHLSIAERLRGSRVAVCGACVGLLAGGPAGLALGAKAGAGAALVGSLLGYFTARALPAPAPAPEPTSELVKRKDE